MRPAEPQAEISGLRTELDRSGRFVICGADRRR